MTESEARRILAVDPQAPPAQVRQAYLDLVKVWHPDRFEHDPRLREKAVRTLQDINDAWAVLQRAASRPPSQSQASSSPPPSETPPPPPPRTPSSPEPGPRHQSPPSAAASEVPRTQPESGWLSRFNVSAGVLALVAGIGFGVFLVRQSPATSQSTSADVPPLPAADDVRDAQPVADDPAPRRAPAKERTGSPRPESGADVRPFSSRGHGALSIVNSDGSDAVVALGDSTALSRLIYVRRGEKVTLLDVAAGEYNVRAMLGRGWDGHVFTTPAAHRERTAPLTISEGAGSRPGVITLAPAAGEFRSVSPFRFE